MAEDGTLHRIVTRRRLLGAARSAAWFFQNQLGQNR